MALQILYFIPGNLQEPAASFGAIVGRLLVSPVLQVLVFGNSQQEVRPQHNSIMSWFDLWFWTVPLWMLGCLLVQAGCRCSRSCRFCCLSLCSSRNATLQRLAQAVHQGAVCPACCVQ